MDLNHPRGGQARYLQEPWEAAGTSFAERMARGLLKPGGLVAEAETFARDGVRMVREHAPVEFDNLRRSGHATVTDKGATVFDEPPEVTRLSETELRTERGGQ